MNRSGGSRTAFLIALAVSMVGSALATSTEYRAVASDRIAATSTPGAFVWHDLVTPDPAACRNFYGALFGWTFEDGTGIDPGYTIIKHEGQPIGGIVPLRRRGNEAPVAQWLSYVVVADVDRAVEAFRSAGGTTFRGPLNARKDLRVAVVADAQGAPLGLASRGPLLVEESVPALHRWLWMEYVAVDVPAALQFYGDLVGFTHEIHEQRDAFTYYLLIGDRPRAGLFRSPWERKTAAWLPYVRVADPSAMAARVSELGGSVALAPAAGIRNGSLAIVLDPTGAPLALQMFPFDGGVKP